VDTDLKSFFKHAQQMTNANLTSTLALKYNQAVKNVGQRFGVGPNTGPLGNTRIPMSTAGVGGSTYNRYVSAITSQESGGRANIVNKRSGALGLYQFMPNTLKDLGYKGTTQDFLKNPALQTQYMNMFTQRNAKQLGIDINKMDMQQARYLAAAHYGGVGGARKLMSGNSRYGNTVYDGKSPYAYTNDIIRRMQQR
jgi:hypothetical protein